MTKEIREQVEKQLSKRGRRLSKVVRDILREDEQRSYE